MPNTTEVVIDANALRHNLAIARALCPRSRIMAMIKADGYGHGLLETARALSGAHGFAVARLDEALRLRRGGIDKRILLLGSLLDLTDVEACVDERLDLVIHDEPTAELLLARHWAKTFNVWLKLDTGMHRLGLHPNAFGALHARFLAHPQIDEIVHMTHFSSADEPESTALDRQLECFDGVCRSLGAALSTANSAALIGRAETRSDWVRPGIMLYGDNPLSKQHALDLRAAMTLTARVLAVREVPAGEAVGYGCSWRADSHCRIATVGIGYGDGYPRHAPSGTPVWVAGQRAPLVGRVSMDSITIDVTGCADVSRGDLVELWGPHISAAEVAQYAGTISYELFTGVNARVPRRHVGD